MRRPRRELLTDRDVEMILFGVGCLRTGFTLEEAAAAVGALQAARAAGDRGWPRTWRELDAVLPRRRRHLWAVPPSAACCPSGVA